MFKNQSRVIAMTAAAGVITPHLASAQLARRLKEKC
jgi:hypothetical protein